MNCYILVGGRSRRMGKSKAGLFLERIVGTVRPLFDDVVAVDRAGGTPRMVRTIFEESHTGNAESAMQGVARALRDATRRCVVMAVDYPLITTEFLAYLIDRAEATTAAAVVPVWHGQPQTLCAVYDPSILPLVEARIARGNYDLRGLIAEACAEMIPEDELRSRFSGEPLFNVNTPEELQQAESLNG